MRVLLVLVAACSSGTSAPSARRAITSDEAAIAAFEAAWEHDVRPTITDPFVHQIDNRMQTADALGLYHAESHQCREGIDRVRELGANLVVHGSPQALLGRDRCWSVLFLGGMKLDVEGWLDTHGHLLIAWRIPEG
jgi:hypothetical protein